jgi:hemolysin activation/secretion protein
LTAGLAVALAGGLPGVRAEGTAPVPAPGKPRPRTLDIGEYRVEGAHQLSAAQVEVAVYPFLGPGRVLEDVERARAALQKAYSDRGYPSVVVSIPVQTVRDGVVTLKVTEGKVGRLRVRGARWFSPNDIKRRAPSVAEGKVPNLDEIVRDIVALNQLPDCRVTPALRAGSAPGTVDVDLNVQDTLPLHASLELNNRYSPSTTQLRLNGSIRYDNLWQLGHSLGFSFQVAPRRPRDGKVFSASYLARLPAVPWLSFAANGLVQDSDVSTLGEIAVSGRGRVFGARALFTLPSAGALSHSVAAGLDYKRFQERISLGKDTLSSPITYWPATAQYGATWSGDSAQMQLTASAVLDLRSASSGPEQFDAKRYDARGSFIYWRGELTRTDDLPLGVQLFAKLQGQYSADPLIGPEQLTAGGAESVRGYLEVQGTGDYGALGTLEVRSPSLGAWARPVLTEWKLHAFAEGGRLGIHEPLPDQASFFLLWSVGVGTRFRILDHLGGTVDAGVPLTSLGPTVKHQPRVHFRLWGEL